MRVERCSARGRRRGRSWKQYFGAIPDRIMAGSELMPPDLPRIYVSVLTLFLMVALPVLALGMILVLGVSRRACAIPL